MCSRWACRESCNGGEEEEKGDKGDEAKGREGSGREAGEVKNVGDQGWERGEGRGRERGGQKGGRKSDDASVKPEGTN